VPWNVSVALCSVSEGISMTYEFGEGRYVGVYMTYVIDTLGV
jgi:hypothetical protein